MQRTIFGSMKATQRNRLWQIWKQHNESIFGGMQRNGVSMLNKIKVEDMLWVLVGAIELAALVLEGRSYQERRVVLSGCTPSGVY